MNTIKNTIKIGLVALALLGIQTAIATPQAFALGTPFAVVGQVSLDGVLVDGASVTLTDTNNGAFLTDTTVATGTPATSGWYAFDLGNLSIIAADGDNIEIVATTSGLTASTSFIYYVADGFKIPATINLVSPVLTSITVSPATASINVGGSQQLTASALDQFGAALSPQPAITWSSSDAAIATVSATGLVTGVAAGGPVTITATSGAILGTASFTVTSAPVTAVNLGSAANFAILSETGITNIPSSIITGNIGASPISGSAIGVTCAEVAGTIYSVDAAGPSPCSVNNPALLTTAVSDMQAAYTDAFNRTPGTGATNLNVGGGTLSGQNFTPGIYTWNTPVNITGNITLTGSATDIWIFQVSGTLTMSSATQINLSGGAKADNIFWQVAGQTTIGTTAVFSGNILGQTGIALQTGATLNGRALAQTAVTLDGNTVTIPTAVSVTGISLNESSHALVIGGTDQIIATIAPANATNQIVTWSSSNPAVATVNSTGLVTAVAIGSSTITATTLDGGFTATSVITVTATPVLTTISVTPTSTAILVGATSQLTATALDQLGVSMVPQPTFTWASDNTAVATVDSTGLVTAVAAGTSTITASSGTISGISSVVVSAVPVLTSISLTPTSSSILVGGAQQFTASPLDQFGNPIVAAITWSSSSSTIATIDTTGLATGVSAGAATITAMSGTISAAANITVSAVPVFTSISLTPATASISSGSAQQFTASALDQFGAAMVPQPAITWASSNTAVATISASGLATAIGVGTTTITADSGLISSSAILTVDAPVFTSISLTPTSTSVSIIMGNTAQLTATALDQFGVVLFPQPSIIWSSASSTVATVDATGLVTGASVGSTIITAASGTISSSITINVTPVPVLTAINVSPTSSLVYIGATQQFTAALLDQFGSPFTTTTIWSSSNTAIGTIDAATGLFTGVAVGTTTITATSGAISGTAIATVAQAPVLTTIQVTPIAGIVKVGKTLEMKAKGYDQAGVILVSQPAFTWSSSNTAVASISSSGLVTGLSVGTSTITAISGTISGTTIITVSTSTIREVSDDCKELEDSGALVPEWGEDYWESTALTATNNIRFRLHSDDGDDEVELPEGVRISREDGVRVDGRGLIATSTNELSLAGLGASLRAEGALKWGLANSSLTFSSPITLRIFVGAGHNGQTLGIMRSVTGTGAWTSDGIVSSSCVISSGVCAFQATKASYYVVTSQAPSQPAASGNVLGTPGGGGGGGGGSGMLATGAPVWLSPNATNNVSTGVSGETTTSGQGAVLGVAIFNFTSNLAIGSRGDAVTELQKRLTAEGVYSGPITGYFGNLTFAGVRAYQAKYGISQVGAVGPLTRARLNSSQVAGASTINTVAIQAQIDALRAKIETLKQQLLQMQTQTQ